MNEDLTKDHWLTWGEYRVGDGYGGGSYEHRIVGCHCGFTANNDADCGWGDSVVRHLMQIAWEQGFNDCANWWEIHHHGVVRDEMDPYRGDE